MGRATEATMAASSPRIDRGWLRRKMLETYRLCYAYYLADKHVKQVLIHRIVTVCNERIALRGSSDRKKDPVAAFKELADAAGDTLAGVDPEREEEE